MPSCICIPCSNRKYAVETIKRPDNGCFGKEDSTVFTIFLLNSHQFDRMYINVRDTIYRNLLSNILRFQVSWRYLNILLIFHCKFPWNSHAPIWITIYPYSRASSTESTISGCTRRSFVTKWTVVMRRFSASLFPFYFSTYSNAHASSYRFDTDKNDTQVFVQRSSKFCYIARCANLYVQTEIGNENSALVSVSGIFEESDKCAHVLRACIYGCARIAPGGPTSVEQGNQGFEEAEYVFVKHTRETWNLVCSEFQKI